MEAIKKIMTEEIERLHPVGMTEHTKPKGKSKEIVDLMINNGFHLIHTGGGCWALYKEFSDGTSCLLTDNDAGVTGLDTGICIGIENKDGEPIMQTWVDDPKNIYIEWE